MDKDVRLSRRVVLVGLAASAAAALNACGGSSPTATVAVTKPAATTSSAATSAPATVSAATSPAGRPVATVAAAPTAAAGGTITIPQGLRTDLKGKSIKAALAADGPNRPWELAAAQKFQDATGISVEVLAYPQNATERLAQILQQMGAKSSDVDVYQIDGTWPGIFAEHAVDLAPAFKDVLPQHFERIVKNATVGGKLIEMPWYTDAGILYYRTDLLKKYGYEQPPQTWTELEQIAKKVQDGERAVTPDLWGLLFQGAAYEGLTCNAIEWQVSHGGGTIIEADGTVSINNPQTVAALDRAKGWVKSIAPPGVTTYKEEEARQIWQNGNTVFMRNWPYVYATSQGADSKIKDKFDVALLPKGDGPNATNADCLGGWGQMVSKYSKNQEAAIEFVKFMTSNEVQKSRSIERSQLPTRPALYDDPDVLKANPFYARLKAVFLGGAVARPSTVAGDRYNDVSVVYFTAVNQILTGQKDTKTAVADMERDIKKAMK